MERLRPRGLFAMCKLSNIFLMLVERIRLYAHIEVYVCCSVSSLARCPEEMPLNVFL